jgi:hypothetical protein
VLPSDCRAGWLETSSRDLTVSDESQLPISARVEDPTDFDVSVPEARAFLVLPAVADLYR